MAKLVGVPPSCAAGAAAGPHLPSSKDCPVGRFPRCSAAFALASVLGLLLQASPARADDRSSTTPTGWWVYTGQTAAQINTVCATYNARLSDLSVEQGGTTPIFTATYVSNSGPYAQAWWWYNNVTISDIVNLYTANQARLVCLKRYQVSGVDKFACIMVSNTGANAKSWWWYQGQTVASLTTLWQANNARITALSSFDSGGTRYYDAIMISNTGADASGWWWYVGASLSGVVSALSTNQARLLDLETYYAGGTRYYNVVMVPNSGPTAVHWWWYVGLTVNDVLPPAIQNGARIFDFQEYPSEVDGTPRFDVVMIGNVDPITTRIGDLLNWGNDGATGCYLKQVGGPQIAGLQPDYGYEPASSIKALIALHYMRKVDAFTENQGVTHSVYTALSGSCPLDATPVSEYFRVSLLKMLKNSDNSRAQFFRQRYGNEDINLTAGSVVGMSNSWLHHRLGCGDSALARPNQLTLADAGLLYERIFDASVLSPAGRDTLRRYLVNETDYFPIQTNLNTIVDQEAAALGKSWAAASFKSNLRLAFKAGSYGLAAVASPLHYDYSISGWLRLPVCDGGVSSREYVFGVFINNSFNQTTTNDRLWICSAELFREQIRAALQGCTLDAGPVAPLAGVLELASPQPNPATHGTLLRYSLPFASAVRLAILDVGGRQVVSLGQRVEGPGEHSVAWDARDANGSRVPAGVYFIRLEAAGEMRSQKVVIEP
jgi:hypothetical protein